MVIFFAFSVPIAISIGLASVTGIHFFSTIPMLVRAQGNVLGDRQVRARCDPVLYPRR